MVDQRGSLSMNYYILYKLFDVLKRSCGSNESEDPSGEGVTEYIKEYSVPISILHDCT